MEQESEGEKVWTKESDCYHVDSSERLIIDPARVFF